MEMYHTHRDCIIHTGNVSYKSTCKCLPGISLANARDTQKLPQHPPPPLPSQRPPKAELFPQEGQGSTHEWKQHMGVCTSAEPTAHRGASSAQRFEAHGCGIPTLMVRPAHCQDPANEPQAAGMLANKRTLHQGHRPLLPPPSSTTQSIPASPSMPSVLPVRVLSGKLLSRPAIFQSPLPFPPLLDRHSQLSLKKHGCLTTPFTRIFQCSSPPPSLGLPVRLSSTRPRKSTGSGMFSFHISEGIQILGARGRSSCVLDHWKAEYKIRPHPPSVSSVFLLQCLGSG